ncbi:DUF5677 domain-containing protein [Enterococcus gallinarum]|uniref:DUF5677 domain-containing protein n=1 Tax=Enterococcus gallinarum TaxID=1353 RepID=UPI002DBF14BF|nr:DUF5677 domain-containing protein [Enterococcus gallinarum]MEB6065125.1 DUF5677 domain-containing protein [Enterococcus gallinarum]
MADYAGEFFKDTLTTILEEKLSNVENQEEADKIIEKIESADLSDLMIKMYSQMAQDTTNFMRKTMFEQVLRFRADELEFMARQEQKWCNAFVASESMYIMTLEAAESYQEYVNTLQQEKLKEKYYLFTAMLHIHGRALQQFLEIISLMKNGFADGAYARWRSMYELSIIASFISENGETVAKAFIDSSETEDRYEWARSSNLFPTSKKWITFSAIESKCDMNTKAWKNQYILANRIIHASSQGTFSRLSNMETGNFIPVGRSDYGITTPAEHSAISLAQITAIFFTIHPSGDSIIAVKYINNWVDVIREEYFKTHDSVFPDDDKLWEEGMVSFEDEVSE